MIGVIRVSAVDALLGARGGGDGQKPARLQAYHATRISRVR